MSRIKAGNFKDGGRAELLRDRRMKDIEKDYKIALAKGKNEGVAKAKYEQRKADAADDYAKRTKADRTETRAAEAAAERTLKKVRKYGAPKAVTTEASTAKVMDSMPAMATPKMDSSIGAKPKAKVKTTVAKAPAKRAVTPRTETRTETPAATTRVLTPASTSGSSALSAFAVPALLARTPFGDKTAARLKAQETERATKAKREETAKAERLAAAKARPTNTGGTLLRGRPMKDEPKKVVAQRAVTPEERRKRDAAYLSTIGKYAAGGAGKVRKGMMKGK
jgi:hypothetical protein